MPERLVSPINFNLKQAEDVRKIGNTALEIVTTNYCSGYPSFAGGKVRMGYHNRHHGYMTGVDSAATTDAVGLGSSGVVLAEATGNAHDLIFNRIRGEDERESAEWIKRRLLAKGLGETAATMAALGILGTEPIIEDMIVADQMANRLDYPSRYAELFAKAIASADLGELYKPQGPYLFHMLWKEVKGVQAHQAAPLEGLAKAQGRQLVMLERYKFPLGKVAEKVLATHKTPVMKYSTHVYGQLQRGEFETHDQLLEQDLDFARNPERWQ